MSVLEIVLTVVSTLLLVAFFIVCEMYKLTTKEVLANEVEFRHKENEINEYRARITSLEEENKVLDKNREEIYLNYKEIVSLYEKEKEKNAARRNNSENEDWRIVRAVTSMKDIRPIGISFTLTDEQIAGLDLDEREELLDRMLVKEMWPMIKDRAMVERYKDPIGRAWIFDYRWFINAVGEKLSERDWVN